MTREERAQYVAFLEQLFEHKTAEQLIKFFERLEDRPLFSFEDYERCHEAQSVLLKAINQLKNRQALTLSGHLAAAENIGDEGDIEDNNRSVQKLMEELETLQVIQIKVTQAWEGAKIGFVEYLLTKTLAELKNILFNDALFTELTIRDRYKKLSKNFHPDKNTDFSDEIKDRYKQLFQFIAEIKEEATKKIHQHIEKDSDSNAVSYYRRQGHEYLERAIDMQNARAAKLASVQGNVQEGTSRWSKLKHYEQSDLISYKESELQEAQQHFADRAYQAYRAAAQHLSRAYDPSNWLQHAQLRQDMMKSWYMQNSLIEAELYGLCALFILRNHLTMDASRFIKEVLSFLAKIRQTAGRLQQQHAMHAEEPLSSEVDDTAVLAMVTSASSALTLYGPEQSLTLSTPFQQREFQQALQADLDIVLREGFLSGHGALIVRHKTHEDNILVTRDRALTQQIAGRATQVIGVLVGATVVVTAAIDIYTLVTAVSVGTMLGGPIGAGVGLLVGLITIVVGLWAGHELVSRGNSMLLEPAIREQLNFIMEDALSAYRAVNHYLFISSLAKNYHVKDVNRREANGRYFVTNERDPWNLVKYKSDPEGLLEADPSIIIRDLLSHGFRPDGIAYLLSILAETLLIARTSTLKIESRVAQMSLDVLAQKLLDAVENNPRLQEEAIILDQQVARAQTEVARQLHAQQELQNNAQRPIIQSLLLGLRASLEMFSASISEWWYHTWAREYYNIPEQYLKDAEKAPFNARLDEIRQICMINKIISDILIGREDNLALARATFDRLKVLVNTDYQYFSVPTERLAALNDLLFAMDPKYVEPELDPESPLPPEELIFSEPDLHDFYAQLRTAESDDEKAEIYLKLAKGHYHVAEQMEEDGNHIGSLEQWNYGKKCYEHIALYRSSQEFSLHRIHCLIRMHYYEAANKELLDKASQWQNGEHKELYWNLRTLSARHLGHYGSARYANTQALAINPRSALAVLEKRILDRFPDDANKGRKRTAVYREAVTDGYSIRINEERPYRILSLDGGGIRGIIPGVWLSELERQTGQPVSKLFDLVAGTSTGGIITSGLVVPTSQRQPKYRAIDILDVYLTQSKRIFGTKGTTAKYAAEGRLAIVHEYFGREILLSQTLLPVVIPVTSRLQPPRTHVFSTRETEHFAPDIALYHAVMATSAAPTFFPEYRMEGEPLYADEPFMDGGVLANNPAGHALRTASDYGHTDYSRVFLWSLGTGDYVHDPLNPNADRTLLFWLGYGTHVVNHILGAGNNDTERETHAALGDNYNRWQIYMGKPIALDDTTEEAADAMVDLALDYIEELEVRESPRRMSVLIENLTGGNSPRLRPPSPFKFFPSKPATKTCYSGILPDGECKIFTRRNVAAEGDCGFLVLQASRTEVANALRMNNTMEIRKQMAVEIQQALMTAERGFSTPEWQILNQAFTVRQTKHDKMVRDVLVECPDFIGPTNQRERDEALLAFLQRTGQSRFIANAFETSLQELCRAEDAVFAYAQSEAAYLAYAEGLENGHIWLGYQSALVYAKTMNISLYIWREGETNPLLDASEPNSLFLMHHFEAAVSAQPPIHMIHTANFTHFEVLEEQPELRQQYRR